jgi:hypothetical protein
MGVIMLQVARSESLNEPQHVLVCCSRLETMQGPRRDSFSVVRGTGCTNLLNEMLAVNDESQLAVQGRRQLVNCYACSQKNSLVHKCSVRIVGFVVARII